MATSQEISEIRGILGTYERTMADAGDELMQLLDRYFYDVSIKNRREMLVTHQHLVQPQAELDHAAETYAACVARWRFTPDATLDATLSRIAAVL